MMRVKKLKWSAIIVILLSLFMVVSIALMRGTAEQEKENRGNSQHIEETERR